MEVLDSNLTLKLARDYREMITTAEQLLKETASQTGDRIIELRVKLNDSLAAARNGLARLQSLGSEVACTAGKSADSYVHEHPWSAIGIGAGLGLAVGVLISRR